MRVRIDEARCMGHGRCYAVAPACFGYDDDGYGIAPDHVIAAEQEETVRRAVLACPETAISVQE